MVGINYGLYITPTRLPWKPYNTADRYSEPAFVPLYEEGQKVLATIFFLFTWVHLYKGGSVYIKYEP